MQIFSCYSVIFTRIESVKYWETARCNGGIVWRGWEKYFVLCLLNHGCVISSNIVTHDHNSSFFHGSASRGLLQCQIPLLQTANSFNALVEIISSFRFKNTFLYVVGTVLTFNSCIKCVVRPGRMHNRTPHCHPVSRTWVHGWP